MPKTKQQAKQERKLRKNIRQAKRDRADLQTTPKGTKPPTRRGGVRPLNKSASAGAASTLSGRLFGRPDTPQTVQQSIPYREMHRDGVCRVTKTLYTKTIQFYDINYLLAQNEDKTVIFEGWCDFLNYFDSSISFQMTFINQRGNVQEFQQSIDIPSRPDDWDSIRREYADMLKHQLAKGNNGLVKTKYITFGIEADSLKAARPRIERVEADILANFKAMGVLARPLTGQERLEILHGQFHPDGREKLRFDWRELPKSGLNTKDFIAPSSFDFRDSRSFRMGEHHGAVSFLQILAPELTDRMLADFLDLDDAITVNMHIRSIDQSEAIKTVKRKLSDLDAMKIAEQKKAVRSGYDMDVLPADLATYGDEAKNLLTDLQSRNERMFLITILMLNTARKKQRLENNIFAASGIAQKYNCTLKRLDFTQEQGLMSSLPLGYNQIQIERGLTTSSTAIFVPFTTQELLQRGEALYYGLNALSNNLIMANRKTLNNPKGLHCKGRYLYRNLQAGKPFAAQMDGQPRGATSDAVGRGEITGGKIIWEVFKNSSDLPPFFLLLVRECNPNNPVSDYTLPVSERRPMSTVYTHQPENSIRKGANPMQTTLTATTQPCERTEPPRFTKRIGSTVYAVSVHFSRSSEETIEDKILRLMEKEAKRIA